nr:unnamed protein product [Callosobruchus chinensis]
MNECEEVKKMTLSRVRLSVCTAILYKKALKQWRSTSLRLTVSIMSAYFSTKYDGFGMPPSSNRMVQATTVKVFE